MNGRCLTDDECSGLLAGTLNADTLAFVEEHLEICADCQASLDRLSQPADEIERLVSTRQGVLDRLHAEYSTRARSGRDVGSVGDEADGRKLSDTRNKDENDVRSADSNAGRALPANLAAYSQTPQTGGESTETGSTSGSGVVRNRDPFASITTESDLSDYEILDEIGRGGMGVVYVARHRTLDRRVAIKMLLTGPHSGARERARFDREARAAARLQHPNIVALHGIGEHDGCPFLVMEFVDGPGLNAEAKSRSIPPREVARIVEIAARAMHHAHCEGVVHRDLKPGNILLARQKSSVSDSRSGQGIEDALIGTPKIADFGLAMSFDPQSDDPVTQFTRTGQFLGTPDFMAPEQVDGSQPVGPAADIYSLGGTLYALLTGRSPHHAPSPVELLQSIRDTAPIRPRQLNESIPRDLETICLKCLEKDPAARYGSALLLAEDLRRFLDDEPVLARRTPVAERFVRWCRRNPIVASLSTLSVILLLSVVVMSLDGWNRTRKALDVADAAKTQAEDSEIETSKALVQLQELSDSQRHELVQYTVKRGFEEYERHGVEVGAMWFLRAMKLDDDDPQHQRPHRLRLAGILRDRIPMTPLDVMRDLELYQPGFFIPHRDLLIIPRPVPPTTLEVLYLDTQSGQREIEKFPIPPDTKGGVSWVSPDNRFVVYGNLPEGYFTLVDIESRKVHAVLEVGGPVTNKELVAFSADGRFVAAMRDGGLLRVWDVDDLSNHRDIQTTGESVAVAIAPRGSRAVTVTGQRINVWNVATGQLTSDDPVSQRLIRAELGVGGGILVASGFGGAVIWRIKDRQLVREFKGESRVSLDATRMRAAIFQPSGDVQVFNLQSGEPVSGIMQHDGPVANVWFANGLEGATAKPSPTDSPSQPKNAQSIIGDTLYVAEEGRTLRRWSISEARQTSPALRHPGTIDSVGRSASKLVTLSGPIIYSLIAWDMPPRPPRTHKFDVPLDISQNLDLLAYRVNSRKQFEIYDTETGERHGNPIPFPNGAPGHFTGGFSPDGQQVAINWGHDAGVEIFDVNTRDSLGRIDFPNDSFMRSIDVSSSSDAILLSSDRTTRIVNRDGLGVRHDVTRKVFEHTVSISRVLGSPDGKFALSRNNRNDLYDLIDTQSGEFAGKKFFPQEQGLDECWSPDSRRIAIGLQRGEARIWTPHSDVQDLVMRHGHDVVDVCFSRDGQWLATGSKDQTARIWNAKTGKQSGPAMQHEHTVTEVRLSPDNRLAVTIDEEWTVNLWDVASGQRILAPLHHPGSTGVLVRFSKSGDHLLVSSAENPIRRIPLTPLPDDTDLEQLRRNLEVQSTFRLAEDGSLIALPIEEMRSRAGVSTTKRAPDLVREE
ncbi:MAG: protein kinase [Rhodopirellula sp.]|nr:protein kinase [Rhodopirellula sp.]